MKLIEHVFQLPGASVEFEGQGTVYLAYAKRDELTYRTLLLAIHGSSRSALSYRDVPFYKKQRDLALQAGNVFAAISNGPATYGLESGFQNQLLLIRYLTQEIHFPFTILQNLNIWASSAGGILLHQLIQQNLFISKVLTTYAIFNPYIMPELPSLLEAYGVSSISDLSPEIIHLPFLYPDKPYRNIKFLIMHGKQDIIVPCEQSYMCAAFINQVGGKADLLIGIGGHSTQNWSLYDDELILKFLKNENTLH